MNDIDAEERNDKLRLGAAAHPRYSDAALTARPTAAESEGAMLSTLVLLLGIAGIAALAGLLGAIFIFSPLWVY